jgi:hypothetical protein
MRLLVLHGVLRVRLSCIRLLRRRYTVVLLLWGHVLRGLLHWRYCSWLRLLLLGCWWWYKALGWGLVNCDPTAGGKEGPTEEVMVCASWSQEGILWIAACRRRQTAEEDMLALKLLLWV